MQETLVFTVRFDVGVLVTAVLGLVLFGIVYNTLVQFTQTKGFLDGYHSLSVVVGVLITLGVLALISWPSALLALILFAASGTPMIVGSIWRYMQRRKADQESIIRGIDE